MFIQFCKHWFTKCSKSQKQNFEESMPFVRFALRLHQECNFLKKQKMLFSGFGPQDWLWTMVQKESELKCLNKKKSQMALILFVEATFVFFCKDLSRKLTKLLFVFLTTGFWCSWYKWSWELFFIAQFHLNLMNIRILVVSYKELKSRNLVMEKFWSKKKKSWSQSFWKVKKKAVKSEVTFCSNTST